MSKTIQLSNLDPEGDDINVTLSGDMFRIMVDGKLQRFRLSRIDLTRLDMFIDDLARRYQVSERYNIPTYKGEDNE